MNRLRLFILLFFLAISIPLAYVVWQTYSSLGQEERAELRYFSETIFDEMEKELATLVQREENRAVDEYSRPAVNSVDQHDTGQKPAFEKHSGVDYILGYLQNNPDGTMQTPPATANKPTQNQEILQQQLEEANRIFNAKKFSIGLPQPVTAGKAAPETKAAKNKQGFSERYLSRAKEAPAKSYLGKKQQRVEEITAEQVYNIASDEDSLARYNLQEQKSEMPAASINDSSGSPDPIKTRRQTRLPYGDIETMAAAPAVPAVNPPAEEREQRASKNLFEVEVAPFQSVSIDTEKVFIFRRIAINNQIYRQGFIILVNPLLHHLSTAYFEDQPLAGFTFLTIEHRDQARNALHSGVTMNGSDFVIERIFPPPFDFIKASLKADTLPPTPARKALNTALVVLAVFLLVGLIAIYQSVHAIVAMSERRSQFVSSVTHELKTPLTNIRMYIEMLEQGIAATPEREQEYLGILGSESARLSGLINNVLELSKLEKKQRRFHLTEGKLEDVFAEVETIMSQKLAQEGFSLQITESTAPSFSYDREVLVQILINLIENSIKFGKQSNMKRIIISSRVQNDDVHISVSDRGPGIPNHALKKIFDDFYRVDNNLTRATGGTGIGLALVKKFALAMGGRVFASNNDDCGCTVTLVLPIT